jgi:hypothetical protein
MRRRGMGARPLRQENAAVKAAVASVLSQMETLNGQFA